MGVLCAQQPTSGPQNGDDNSDLLERIEDLPSGMEQLYLQMWKRLNGDEERYRQEATVYFSYILDNLDDPLSLFEMQVALDKPLKDKFLDGFTPQNPHHIASECEKLKNRISTRCAGLLETIIDEDRDTQSEWSDSDRSEDVTDQGVPTGTKLSDSDKLGDDDDDHAPINEIAGDVLQHTLADEASSKSIPSGRRRSSIIHIQPEGKLLDANPLRIYYYTKVKFLHRTARDFS